MKERNVKYIISCRRADDGGAVRLDAVRGYWCRVCGIELQVTPPGVAQIAEGGTPVCNCCGITLARKTAKLGVLAGVEINPAAAEQIARLAKLKAES
jgi:hypothetical protein